LVEVVRTACCAGAPRGAPSRGTCGLRTGSGTGPGSGTTSSRAASIVPLTPCFFVFILREAQKNFVTPLSSLKRSLLNTYHILSCNGRSNGPQHCVGNPNGRCCI